MERNFEEKDEEEIEEGENKFGMRKFLSIECLKGGVVLGNVVKFFVWKLVVKLSEM